MIRLLTLALAFGLASAADAQNHHPANHQAETAQTATSAPDLEPVAAVNEPRMLRQGAMCCECCDHGSEAGAMCEMHGEGYGAGHDATAGHECCCKKEGTAGAMCAMHGDTDGAGCCCMGGAEGHASSAHHTPAAEHACCGRDAHGAGHHGAQHHSTHAAPASSDGEHHSENGEAHLTSDAVGHLHSALTAYFAIGDALANDSMEGVNGHARDFGSAMHELANTDVHGDEHFWHSRMSALQLINQRAANIAASSDLQDVRLEYGYLSDALEGVVRATGLHGMDNVYVMICGMYRDAPQNGVWLQTGGTPRNPYFGSSMLRCARSQTSL